MLKKIFALSLLLITFQISFTEKILIITYAYNRPDFIEIQHRTFQKFLTDDYKFIVFNDASAEDMAMQIEDTCQKNGVPCIRIPQEIHTQPYLPRPINDPLKGHVAIRNANVVQYSLDTIGFDHQGIVLIVDSDIFLVRPLHISDYMKDKNILAVMRGAEKNVRYFWPGLCFLHMDKLPDKRSINFNCSLVYNDVIVDAGGWTHYYLQKHPALQITELDTIWSHKIGLGNFEINEPIDHSASNRKKRKKYKKIGFNKKEIRYLLKKPDTFEFLFNKCFFHYHGGSNHRSQSQHYIAHKNRLFKEYINDILSD